MIEEEIRPQEILDKYVELTANDAFNMFSAVGRKDLDCPACNSEKTKYSFTKSNFEYVSCCECDTLYQSPRPAFKHFLDFYIHSRSSRYWSEVFFPAVIEARRVKLIKPKAKQIHELIQAVAPDCEHILEVGAGAGVFLQEASKLFPSVTFSAIEPDPILAKQCRDMRFSVIEKPLEDVAAGQIQADIVVCFEVFEHVYNPFDFITKMASLVKPGGHLLITTLCIDGFDLQYLWDQSKAISPPHHLNFFSKLGFISLCERVGLERPTITTPGKLDVDIVKKAYQADETLIQDKFIKRLFHQSQSVLNDYQRFLAANQLSSHIWVMARKPS